MSTIYGYARVSTLDQDLELQIAALKAAGCNVIRSEKRSGTSTTGREELRTLLDFIRKGDTLTVTRIDRLARSIGDLQDIVRELRVKGAALKAVEQPIDTSTASGKAFLDMLGVFAEFETNLRRERQLEGVARAKANGVYKGRPATIDAAAIAKLKADGLGATEIAKRLKVARASVYRVLASWPASRHNRCMDDDLRRWRIALHESGHAVRARALWLPRRPGASIADGDEHATYAGDADERAVMDVETFARFMQHAAIREERAKKRRVILFALFALEVADVLTTNRFLAGGNASEGNPFMAAMQQSFGTFWWAPKLAIAMVAGLIVAQGRPRYLLTLVGMMALVVTNNALLP